MIDGLTIWRNGLNSRGLRESDKSQRISMLPLRKAAKHRSDSKVLNATRLPNTLTSKNSFHTGNFCSGGIVQGGSQMFSIGEQTCGKVLLSRGSFHFLTVVFSRCRHVNLADSTEKNF